MNSATHSKIVSFIWGIADDVLRDLYVRGKYRDVILPFTVLRRLDSVLEPTKQAVLDMKKALDANQIDNQDADKSIDVVASSAVSASSPTCAAPATKAWAKPPST